MYVMCSDCEVYVQLSQTCKLCECYAMIHHSCSDSNIVIALINLFELVLLDSQQCLLE